MDCTELLISLLIGLLSGFISGLILSDHYKALERKKELSTGIYEFYMYLSIVRYALEEAISGKEEPIKEVLKITPYPLLSNFNAKQRKEIDDTIIEKIENANEQIRKLRVKINTDEECETNQNDFSDYKNEIIQSSLDLLKARQKL